MKLCTKATLKFWQILEFSTSLTKKLIFFFAISHQKKFFTETYGVGKTVDYTELNYPSPGIKIFLGFAQC